MKIDYFQVIARYYSSLSFAKVDAALFLSYLFSNPFRLSKRFLMQKGESDVYTYGETPLSTMEQITSSCGITKNDTVFELGCGRGRVCFWLNTWVQCAVVGIDYVPAFIEKGQAIQKKLKLDNLLFRLEDIFEADLSGATVIYLYGTCYSEDQICLLIDRFSSLQTGTKIITVSYSLNEFRPSAPFRLLKQFPAFFTWGIADVYCQVRD